jgi:hypothetical protein
MPLRKSPTLTPVRIEANRHNAKKSTGPRTPCLPGLPTFLPRQSSSQGSTSGGSWGRPDLAKRILFVYVRTRNMYETKGVSYDLRKPFMRIPGQGDRNSEIVPISIPKLS